MERAYFGPTFGICLPCVGFIHHKARGKGYHKPPTYIDQEAIGRKGGDSYA